ncbi:MAG: T9SS type A sorting domain-containing protein [Bacteroidales bacterium]|nr:T9SS type A sorting domain-containing protein [Bacteroidales bacterium]
MKNKLLTIVIICLGAMNLMGTDPGYHFQIDFTNESSDNIEGWTTNRRPDHPYGGVAVSSGGYARFRNAVAAMKTNSAFTYAGTLSFNLKPDTYGTNNPTFKVYTSTNGTDWETAWIEVFATSYNELNVEGNNFSVEINSGTTAVYLKLESVNDDTDNAVTEYSFQLDNLVLTNNTDVTSDNVEVGQLTSSCLTVSSEKIIFAEGDKNIYTAHDSIGFDAICNINCIPIAPLAKVEMIKKANPYPGKSDTAIFKITAEDNITTATVKVIVARSFYLSKFGFLAEITNTTSEFDGWTFGGNRYPTGSRGNGGAYPGENAIRIYESGGHITTPKYSGISTISFVAKFSMTDGELLKVQKSYDGINFTDLITYTPGSGSIPTYTTESIDDSISDAQTIDINDRDVFIRFQYVSGNSADPRTLIDDIACLPIYDPDETFEVLFKVKDFSNLAVEGATVTFRDQELTTNINGEVTFSNIPFQMEGLSYSVTKTDYIAKSGTILVKSNMEKNITITKEELEIFLALGQSNMAGRADIDDNTDPIEGAWLLNDEDVWIPAVNPMNLYSNIRKDAEFQLLGPSYAFAKTMAEYIDKPICVIVNARGGTSLSAFSEGGEYNQPMMDRIRKANDFGTVKAAIWHQGESNSSSFGSYLTTLNKLVVDIREAVNSNLYFVAGQLGPWGTKYELFNNNLTTIQSFVDNADYAINERLWHLGDETHFNTPSQLLLGSRYAQKVLESVYDVKIGIYEFTFPEKLFVTSGNDTIHSGERVIYTSLWNEDLSFKVFATEGERFEGLTLNGVNIASASGQLFYEFNLTSRDTVFNIEANLEVDITALKGEVSKDLSFYPNPASEKLVFGGGNEFYKASIYEMTGRLLLEEKNSTEMDISFLKSGYYILHLQSGEKTMASQLIVY